MNEENGDKMQNDLSLSQLFLVFLQMGFTAFGPAMMMETKKSIVKKLKWINENEFLEGLALAQLIPGATFVSLTIYIGYKLKGLLGAVTSFLGFILPPFFFMTVLSWIYFKYQSITFMSVLFKGLGAVVVALVLNAIWDLAKSTTTNIRNVLIAAVSLALSVFNMNIALILFIAAFLGIVIIPKSAAKENKTGVDGPAKMQWWDIIIITVFVMFFFGTTLFSGKLFLMAVVFFKIGALVLGNGFTMLPFIQQEVVRIHHWLNLDQFMVGLALGQVTPGPVSITATFIGYKVMGFMGATVATLAIFLPSFLLVVLTFGVYAKIKNYTLVNSVVKGLLASFVGLMVLMIINMGRHALVDLLTIELAVLSFIMLRFIKLDSKWVILGGTGLYLIACELTAAIKF